MENMAVNRYAGMRTDFVRSAMIKESHELDANGICKNRLCDCDKSASAFKANAFKLVTEADLKWSLGKGPSPYRVGGEMSVYIDSCTKVLGYYNRQG
jgi:hypothetical protein